MVGIESQAGKWIGETCNRICTVLCSGRNAVEYDTLQCVCRNCGDYHLSALGISAVLRLLK